VVSDQGHMRRKVYNPELTDGKLPLPFPHQRLDDGFFVIDLVVTPEFDKILCQQGIQLRRGVADFFWCRHISKSESNAMID
jgi:hypothetical protein